MARKNQQRALRQAAERAALEKIAQQTVDAMFGHRLAAASSPAGSQQRAEADATQGMESTAKTYTAV